MEPVRPLGAQLQEHQGRRERVRLVVLVPLHQLWQAQVLRRQVAALHLLRVSRQQVQDQRPVLQEACRRQLGPPQREATRVEQLEQLIPWVLSPLAWRVYWESWGLLLRYERETNGVVLYEI